MRDVPIAPPMPLPGAYQIPEQPLAPPIVKMPQWQLVPVRPEDVKQPKAKTKAEEQKKEDREPPRKPVGKPDIEAPPLPTVPAEVKYIDIPFTDIEIPVPKEEIVVTAVTTAGTAAVVSVGATLAATSLFKEVMKIANPILKTIVKKLAKLRGKPAPLTWSRQRLKESHQRKQGRTDSKGGS